MKTYAGIRTIDGLTVTVDGALLDEFEAVDDLRWAEGAGGAARGAGKGLGRNKG
mgnify:CR=1 FL=1